MGFKAHVDLDKAKEILTAAYNEASSASSTVPEFDSLVDKILDGTHLTYKYVLFTELLAKATCEDVNPLCLQASSDLDGAYDARSLCHKVIVPFEKNELDKILGGSNEPFLNKPARFPEISPNNAVRRGKDYEALMALVDGLPALTSPETARKKLIYFLKKCLNLKSEREENTKRHLEQSALDRSSLMRFFKQLLEDSNEGESLTLVVANIYNLMYGSDNDMTIEVHPVNQCGASSKEISDLDIKEQGVLFIANELKDKTYTITDIEHAADKVIDASGNQMFFIVGRNGSFEGVNISSVIQKYESMGMTVKVIPIDEFIDIVYPLCRNASIQRVIEYSAGILKDKKFKKATETYFYSVVDDFSDCIK